MPKDHMAGVKDYYDVVVVGSGLGGLTGANCLAKQGHSVLLLEHHYQFGGLATWFKRAGGHIFDISSLSHQWYCIYPNYCQTQRIRAAPIPHTALASTEEE